MKIYYWVCFAGVPSWAQQFSGFLSDATFPGLSTSCNHAINTTIINCPIPLNSLSLSHALLNTDSTTALCKAACSSSLQSAKTAIHAACTATTDVVVFNNVAYPATYVIDNYIYTYGLSCRKDLSGQFCDPQLLSWRSLHPLTPTQLCSDCWLGERVVELNSPFGYDANIASDLSSLTSRCSATGYAFTSPGPYALNSTATTLPPPVTATHPATCTGSYLVQPTDSCNSVAKALNVSTFNLLKDNNLDLYCANFGLSVGSNLCIPPKCNVYTWKSLDTCEDVVRGLVGVTIPQFLSWNPNLNGLCQNGPGFDGFQVCLSPPGGYVDFIPGTTITTPIPPPPTAVPVPSNAMDGSNRNCGKWYEIVSGDTCAKVALASGTSLTDFYFLNPEIDSTCSNLLLGISYCVLPVGTISTYPGYTATNTPLFTITSASFPPVNTAIPTRSSNPGPVPTASYLPKAPGTLTDCATYRNYDSSLGLNVCYSVASGNGISLHELLAWNPSLPGGSTCQLQAGYSYCVGQADSPPPVNQIPSNCLPLTQTPNPGTAGSCNCYTQVKGYQSNSMTCARLSSENGITLTQLTAWNTWLSTNCDTALYNSLATYDSRAVCIGVGAAYNTPTPTQPTASAPGPTQTNIVQGCTLFYNVQSGNTCEVIDTRFGITFAQFLSWNPSVGSNCENLWLDYSYCVEGPIASTTTSGPPAPTQTGVAANCNRWYTVKSGDSCQGIETQYSITFAQLLQWNPAIGSNCESLWVDYAVCVGVGS